MQCRGCGSEATQVFCDLGAQPLANGLLTKEQLGEPETRYPLVPVVCQVCRLVQLPEIVAPEKIFTDYPYFSSQSKTFVEHARRFASEAIGRFQLDDKSLVVEIASNDGYLLQHFVQAGVPCYGVEPAVNVAEYANERGINTYPRFFDAHLAIELTDQTDGWITGGQADLIVANNVLAHVPKLSGFVRGLQLLMKKEGVLSIEVPYLRHLIDDAQIGQLYHEHFSYFLFTTLRYIFGIQGMRIFDVRELNVHGGSLRVFICHNNSKRQTCPRVAKLEAAERRWLRSNPLDSFADEPRRLKSLLWDFILSSPQIVGYGAAAKAATVLSYCGIGPEYLSYIVDTTPAKQGRYLGGTRIPIVGEDALLRDKPELIWVLPWNLSREIIPRLERLCREWDPNLTWQGPGRMVFNKEELVA